MPPSPGRIVDATDDLIKRLGGKPIRAYHGSPYDWDRVDMSMVGKGEGPLDEGFGLYATDTQGVADWYRYRTTHLRRNELAEQLRQIRAGFRASPPDPEWHRKYHRAIKLSPDVHQMRSRLQRQFPRGRTYELQIAVPRDSLMEYDVPVYAQQPEVLDRMRSIDPKLVDAFAQSPDADGAMFYNTLAGGNILDPPTVQGQRRASEMLFKAGIPGHAYRGKADNYVFYPGTEDSITILRKYGLLPPLAGAAAMQGSDEP